MTQLVKHGPPRQQLYRWNKVVVGVVQVLQIVSYEIPKVRSYWRFWNTISHWHQRWLPWGKWQQNFLFIFILTPCYSDEHLVGPAGSVYGLETQNRTPIFSTAALDGNRICKPKTLTSLQHNSENAVFARDLWIESRSAWSNELLLNLGEAYIHVALHNW
jgi:hypothetical protein